MDFREASDLVGMTAVELAKELGVSPATVRQARLTPDKDGYRPPPKGWEAVLARIARERCPELKRVAELDSPGKE